MACEERVSVACCNALACVGYALTMKAPLGERRLVGEAMSESLEGNVDGGVKMTDDSRDLSRV